MCMDVTYVHVRVPFFLLKYGFLGLTPFSFDTT